MALGESSSKRRTADVEKIEKKLDDLTELINTLKSEEQDSENKERDEHADCY
ncbi:hypothetical protein IKE84_01310 [Candidatus Saccharibacteria bacterium]|nr:hypothetical protein [Candidatus Saccharibacteria bacterium]